MRLSVLRLQECPGPFAPQAASRNPPHRLGSPVFGGEPQRPLNAGI
jgi:hypothetical protein